MGVDVTFYVPRPKSVTREYPEVKPDADKLLRCTLDALTGIAYRDDAQVIAPHPTKLYANDGQPGAASPFTVAVGSSFATSSAGKTVVLPRR